MAVRPGMCIKLMENRMFMTLAGLAMVLLTVAGMVVGMGMSPIHMWLIMASVCVVWLSFCRCITWQRKTTERLRSEEVANRHLPVGTISEDLRRRSEDDIPANQRRLNDNMMMMMMMRDTPPSYDVTINAGLEQLPPSYSSVVAKLTPEELGVVICEGELPPPYEGVDNNVGTEDTRTQQSVEQSSEYICVISADKETTETPV